MMEARPALLLRNPPQAHQNHRPTEELRQSECFPAASYVTTAPGIWTPRLRRLPNRSAPAFVRPSADCSVQEGHFPGQNLRIPRSRYRGPCASQAGAPGSRRSFPSQPKGGRSGKTRSRLPSTAPPICVGNVETPGDRKSHDVATDLCLSSWRRNIASRPTTSIGCYAPTHSPARSSRFYYPHPRVSRGQFTHRDRGEQRERGTE